MCLAVPGKVISVEDAADDTLRRGKVDFAGVRKEISLAFTPEAKPGDFVLVHVGFALNVVDPEEAQKIFEDLKRLGELEEFEREAAGESEGPDSP
jgi:hydrogenase expression/formation protein HypC